MFSEMLQTMRALPPRERRKAMEEVLEVMALLLEEQHHQASDPKCPDGLSPPFCDRCPFLRKN